MNQSLRDAFAKCRVVEAQPSVSPSACLAMTSPMPRHCATLLRRTASSITHKFHVSYSADMVSCRSGPGRLKECFPHVSREDWRQRRFPLGKVITLYLSEAFLRSIMAIGLVVQVLPASSDRVSAEYHVSDLACVAAFSRSRALPAFR